MRLTHTTVVLDFDGEPIPYADGEPMTFRDLAVLALNTPPPDVLSAEVRVLCYQLTGKFFHGKTAKLSVDEGAFLKDRARAVILSPLWLGRLCDWVEGKEQSIASDDEEPDDEDPGTSP